MNIEKIVVVPDGDPCADIRPDEQEQSLQNATPSLQEHNVVQPQSIVFIKSRFKQSRTFIWTISLLIVKTSVLCFRSI